MEKNVHIRNLKYYALHYLTDPQNINMSVIN